MSKPKEVFICDECGATFSKWRGQCSECKGWNTIQAEAVVVSESPLADFVGYAGQTSELQVLAEVQIEEALRLETGISEFDRVLGGGLVRGSCVLLGGHPGAGKSTLLLQIACELAERQTVIYVTGEESPHQVAGRARRLGLPLGLKLLAETRVEKILEVAEQARPEVLVIDSIQVMYLATQRSAPGSVAQVRESAAALTRFGKQTGTIILIVGHVTKDGSLAGPKTLEHIIDASLLLEGSSDSRYRTLRGQKNRFGAVNELGVFAMLESGLKEVLNPCAIFLSRPDGALSGSAVTALWEGTRPLLVELQALVDKSKLEIPRRVVVGLDGNRLAMLLAVLSKHARIALGGADVFVNVVGGVRSAEPSTDLAMAAALLSSHRDLVLPRHLIIFGEVGLSGEIRPIPHGGERLAEAAKHGFTKALVPSKNVPKKQLKSMLVHGLEHIGQLYQILERAHNGRSE